MASEIEIKNSKILIVDDEPANLSLIEKVLELEGYSHFFSTADSTQVEELFLANKPDLILLDLNMPVMDGFDVLEKLSSIVPEEQFPAVLVLTAQIDRDTRIRALSAGVKDYVTKPFDRLELLSRIRIQLEVKLLYKTVREHNQILEQKVAERTDELNRSRLEIIHRLGLAAEYRDNETGLHIIRMSKMSMEIARAIGLSEKECDLVLNASPMHDIGKLGIPDSVLLKPGKLSMEEWEVMKTHVQIGAEILSGSDSELLETARIIALSHHERWDGTGYPAGLKGNDIPLYGRIVALADVFDALTSERPYKQAWSVGKAVDYILSMSDIQFDPELVKVFMDVLPLFCEIRDLHPEHTLEKQGPVELRVAGDRVPV